MTTTVKNMSNLSPTIVNQIFDAVKSANNILLVSHIHPDGDSLSSMLAFYKFLLKNDKQATMFVADNLPPDFNFLVNFNQIETNFVNLKNEKFDLIVFLDCGDYERSGLKDHQEKITNTQTINIDHHYSNNKFANVNLVMPSMSSTAEILFHFFEQINFILDINVASLLLTGILTDTNFFVYSNANAVTLKVAGELIKLGAKTNVVLENVYQGLPYKSLKIFGKALARLNINQENKLATTAIFLDDLEESRATSDDLEGLNDHLNRMFDVEGTCVFKEAENGLIKGSLRTMKNNVDVSLFAQKYGGGGHKKAAGFKTAGKIVKTEEGGWKIEKTNF